MAMSSSLQHSKPSRIDYVAEPTARAFHKCDMKVRGILGPFSSGKSSTCVMEIMLRAMAQQPDMKGVRRTRWAVVRGTYSELITTTIKTFRKWFTEDICTYKSDRPLSATLKMRLADGTDVECEVLFLACDRAEDAGKFRSLEITGAWVNEASEIEGEVIDILTGRVGRYPEKWLNEKEEEVGGPTWNGVVLDTNAPDDESYWYRKFEIEKPSNWVLFRQPPAVLLSPISTPQKPVYVMNTGQNPGIAAAENIHHIPIGWKYYEEMLPGKSYEYVKVFMMAEYGTVTYGRAVYTEYNDVVHYAPNITGGNGKKMDVELYGGLPIFLGWDFGVQHSACVIAQLSPKGQLRVVEEILGEDCGIRQFAAEIIRPRLRTTYHGAMIISTGDPAGNNRVSDRHVEDAGFLRLQLLQLGYSFSGNTLQKMGFASLRCYLSGSNLFVITPYSGLDPENYTTPTTFSVGVNLNF